MSINLADSGYDLLRSVLLPEQCVLMCDDIAALLSGQPDGVIGSSSKRVVGGRNLQAIWNGWRSVCDASAVGDLLNETLGDRFGLVRILFFDKPPGQSWNLGVHRDKTIAVAEHHKPADPYGKPTVKAGVPHVVADDRLLEQMVTLRLHLDAMHSGNGPLIVVPGSHRDREQSDRAATIEIHCDAGDVFVMRPLLLHGSLATLPDCLDHRRVVHLEFAPDDVLAAPYRWFQYDTF